MMLGRAVVLLVLIMVVFWLIGIMMRGRTRRR
jgi:hypothetical protein